MDGTVVEKPSYISILSVLQSASAISKYRNVSFTFERKKYIQLTGRLYFDGKVAKANLVLEFRARMHPYKVPVSEQ